MNFFELIIMKPFGWILTQLYNWTDNYGVAIILFAVLVQLVLLPITAKSKKSTMKMSRLQPKIQAIKKKYPDDQQKQNEAITELQKQEGAGMGCGGCLWAFVPMLILIPLLSVIRAPIVYMLGETPEIAKQITEKLVELAPSAFDSGREYYNEVVAAGLLRTRPDLVAQLGDIAVANPETLNGLNFGFLGMDLGSIPAWQVWNWEVWNWATIGLFLIPVVSAGSQVLQMFISQKMNNSVITNEKGLQDKDAAKDSQANQTSKIMMWTMPLMSLWIGFTVPAGLSLYWFIGGVIRMIEDVILTKHYRKVYDAEDAARLQKTLEEDAIEAEKERVRAERRAANPDGITENTSKKKLQQKQRKEAEAAKAAAAKEYAAKKGEVVEEEQLPLSGVKERPYCKGRAYDPNRYNQTEENE